MDILSTRADDTTRMEVVGELDIAGGPRLDEAVSQVLEDGCREVVIDLARTTFLDSAGMGALIRAVRDVEEHGASMSVLSPPGSEARLVLEMARIGNVVGLRDA